MLIVVAHVKHALLLLQTLADITRKLNQSYRREIAICSPYKTHLNFSTFGFGNLNVVIENIVIRKYFFMTMF